MAIEYTNEFLFTEIGLYESIETNTENYHSLCDILLFSTSIHFDTYCVECEKTSTFRFSERLNAEKWNPFAHYSVDDKIEILNSHRIPIQLIFNCSRDSSHIYSFNFRVTDHKLTKIGQYPSIADLQIHDIKKYRNVLKDDYRDFSKSIGLYSHGIGAGSFVYLRRIFENLIEENRLLASKESSWNNESFQQCKMDEKIKMLENYLPQILVENRKLYSILSKGIHELSEADCLELFPNVKLAIELILDEKIYKIEQEKKTRSVKNFVSSTFEKLKG
ncbi:hypothetical protein [Heyndrickxia oleronia]|uniref:hypothetical protein n=1 Tax=Heyndrickxia oleronia TaxID=38875 RepID=UPI001C0F2BC3|nr:hypothetical protein [Heyndrickxia oleronia]MBU5214580.1 hypothetical protein [Heyndrickxia oleronia]